MFWRTLCERASLRGRDEVDDVEETASLHVNGERHVRVRLVTTRVDSLVTLHSHHVHVPFLILPPTNTHKLRVTITEPETKYVDPVPTYCAAVRLLHKPNPTLILTIDLLI